MALSKLRHLLSINEFRTVHQQITPQISRLLFKVTSATDTHRWFNTQTCCSTKTLYLPPSLLTRYSKLLDGPPYGSVSGRRWMAEDHRQSSSFQLKPYINRNSVLLILFVVVILGAAKAYVAHGRAWMQHKAIMSKLHACVLTAQNAVKDGKFKEALDHYRQARVYIDQIQLDMMYTSIDKVTLDIVDQLGHLSFELGNWEEAEIFLKETDKVMLKCGIEEDDDKYVEVILRLAYIDTVYSRQDDALERFNFCIKTLEYKISKEETYSDEYSDRLTLYGKALTDYGTYTKQLGLLDESEHAFSLALNVCRSVLGPNHEQTSVLANDLATVCDEKGKFDKAIRLAETAIKIAGETAPGNLAMYKYNLALIIMHKGGDMSRARNALLEALLLADEIEDNETKELAESSIMKLELEIS